MAKGLHPRREPSGRLSRSTEDAIDAISPAAVRRLRDAALQKHADPLWGSEIGRLFLSHKLTSVQFEAAKRWARLGVEYRLAVGAPPPHERPGTLGTVGVVNGSGLGDDPAVDTAEGRRLRERRLRSSARWKPPLPPWAPGWPRRCATSCELDKAPVGVAGLTNLQRGLDVLARLWGLVR